ncbi:hypothetical protein EVJ27_05355 [Exiguobacterium sp. SH3S2]|uniref:hypothetical protein n=1 Tax=unclassified Exiguobacterium TaxID=2644629 RepID=UPI00103FF2F2|nr:MULTISPECIES: hypothetical protein [unclassified Exiguobacterium]TCI46333.1 hypothetical protein EVJ28_05350 [Exiguobacterium sp. SH3S3]TCI57060.1 hypothetical protein EVJ30_02065 [Exiguobacterium sp. SH5S13]TCI61974.1 hypothetical protein EVJ27_05355 [Exiguobacterium sp. SH3S2]TCI62763.1 hypothetical protein EVJ26_07625 [Exiguobacterium sp. SH3S1]
MTIQLYVWLGFIVISMLLGVRLNQLKEPEPNFFAKFLFYSLLGIVSFPIGGFHIPIGFLMSFLFFPKRNSRYKWYGALVGFFFFIVLLFVPLFDQSEFRAESQQIGPVSVQDESFDRMTDTILRRINGEVIKLDRSKMIVDRDGELQSLEYLLMVERNSSFQQIRINYDDSGELEYRQVDEMNKGSGRAFFEKLVDFEHVIEAVRGTVWEDFAKQVEAPLLQFSFDGLYDMYTFENEAMLMINRDGRIVKFWLQREPVLANSIQLTGLTREGRATGEKYTILYNYSIHQREDLTDQ